MGIPFINLVRFAGCFQQIKWLGWFTKPDPLPGGVLDEQFRLLRRSQELLGELPLDHQTPAQAREHINSIFPLLKSIGGLFETVDSVRDLQIPGPAGNIPARLYQMTRTNPQPLLVYFHGGGWAIGNIDTADNISRFICKRAGCHVLSVDYRLAPEHRFPAAVEDAAAAVQWAQQQAGLLCIDPNRILAGGDSAGGNLAAVLAQISTKNSGLKLAGQVLLYAALDATHLDTPSYLEFGDKPLGLTKADVEWFLDQYVPDEKTRHDPRVSPTLAPDLSGLPPALVVTAEFDVLRDEGEAYARRLEKAGVPVTLMRCNGMIHGFLSSGGLISRVEGFFDQVADHIREMVK